VEITLIVIFTLFGMIVASFLNVCIDRLPGNESLLFPASHCAFCHRRLAVKDLIPVFSYLWLRGRCRYCQAPIPKRILWVEIGTGALFGYLSWHMVWQHSSGIAFAVTAFYCCLFIVLMVIDWEHGLILNKIVYPAMAVALLISVFLSQSEIVPEIKDAAIGGGIGLALFLLIVIVSRGGMGWGDVKLAALIGIVTGFSLVFVALLMGIILGGLVAVLLLALKIKKRKEAIPFGPFLSVAAIVTLLWGNYILDWYRGLF
jgi:leader peptidase (prepilin peptidase)/N-methyltransferase